MYLKLILYVSYILIKVFLKKVHAPPKKVTVSNDGYLMVRIFLQCIHISNHHRYQT